MFGSHETKMLRKLVGLECMLSSKLRACFNKYIVARTFWKGMAVPVGMYAMEALVYSRKTIAKMEGIQNRVARKALGAGPQVAIEALQGEMGWFTFRERDIKTKLKFFGRVLLLSEERMVNRIGVKIMNGEIRSKWIIKVRRCAKSLGMDIKNVKGCTGGRKEWFVAVDKAVKDWGHRVWREGLAEKASLKLYASKRFIGRELFYDNSVGSRLLFNARCGCLPTQEYKARYDVNGIDTSCGLCKRGGRLSARFYRV